MGADVYLLVTSEFAGSRLDAYLGAQASCPSRSACARLIEGGAVDVNGDVCTSKKYVVCDGDRIEVELPEVREPGALEPQAIPLDIRYEDDYLIVLSKQRGLVCHPAHGHESGTLANALVYHCGADHLGTLQGEDRPGIVHRLDRDTSGLMLAAKDDDTQRALQDLIRLRTLDRRYIALCHGYIAMDSGTINTGIARSTKDRVKMAVSDDPFARQAITTFKVLERFEAYRGDEGYTLVECHLYTGRTHQIRVHMRHIHHALVGDPLYGTGSDRANLGLDRQFLHSWRVRFDHPVTGVTIERRDVLPWDLAAAYDEIADRSMGRTEEGERIVPYLLEE
ncbi:RluA family pseudouridine synthase [Collinsella tanakaei]|uniref:RluA family pseudouridine synthase n=1 Tax=Collinsella tanakaei TaxID=626935 RepID=UPI0025A34FAB|nr:RluA family pseudouridine synthase [Collinsella tanakaei]MDM8300571.1 RluA family pseudouridine synthase [Collinsella tanakaei]